MGAYHPESPARLEAIYSMLDKEDRENGFPIVPAREATEAEITAVHTPEYVGRIAQTADRGRLVSLDPDTSACPDTYQAAKLAAGGLLELVDAVQARSLDNGFALVRPPGHHAEADQARGFCIFNNVGIAAAHLLRRHGAERVLIVDWDIHHGNATQHQFYDSPHVLYFSTHQYPYYPGTGALEETGSGAGKGYNINVPMRPGAGDYEYFALFRELVQPLAEAFKPHFILVSAGFDTYYQDPLGYMQVTPEGFAGMTRFLLESAEKLCEGRLALTLEGGYDLGGLQDSVRAVLHELAGRTITEIPTNNVETEYKVNSLIERVKNTHKETWKCLA